MARRGRYPSRSNLPPVIRRYWLRLWAEQHAGPTGPGRGQVAQIEGSVG